MALRICLVTPFAWSRPHVVNEHVDGVARELRRRGHRVTVLAPRTAPATSRPAAARSASDMEAEVIALGPAVPVSRRSSMGVPVGVRTALATALANGRFDVVHGFEPGLPSLSYLALRDTRRALGGHVPLAASGSATRRARRSASASSRASTRSSPPPRRRRRRPRPASPATSWSCRRASTRSSSAPAAKRRLIVLEWRHERADRSPARSSAACASWTSWELVLLRTKPLTGRPYVAHAPARPRALPPRARRPQRAPLLAEAAIFVPGVSGLAARAAGGRGRPAARSPRRRTWPSSRSWPRRRWRAWPRTTSCASARAERARAEAEGESFATVAAEPRRRSTSTIVRRRRPADAPRRPARGPALGRRRPAHAHGVVARLLHPGGGAARPRRGTRGSGAIAVTDHNAFGGALEAARARPRAATCRHPRRGDQDGRPGRGDRPLPARGDPARPVLRRHGRGDHASRAASSTSRTRSTACTRSRTRPRCAATCRTSTCSRSTTRACCSRGSTTRRSASRASTTC